MRVRGWAQLRVGVLAAGVAVALVAGAGPADPGAAGRARPVPMRLFHLSIGYLTLLFAAVAVTALLPWGRW